MDAKRIGGISKSQIEDKKIVGTDPDMELTDRENWLNRNLPGVFLVSILGLILIFCWGFQPSKVAWGATIAIVGGLILIDVIFSFSELWEDVTVSKKLYALLTKGRNKLKNKTKDK